MPAVGFEPTISSGEKPQTYTLDRADTETGHVTLLYLNLKLLVQYYVVVLFETPFVTHACVPLYTSVSEQNGGGPLL